MEFIELIQGEKYSFSYVAKNLFLVTAANKEFILYKTIDWHCADEIEEQLLEMLGQTIDAHLQVTS